MTRNTILFHHHYYWYCQQFYILKFIKMKKSKIAIKNE